MTRVWAVAMVGFGALIGTVAAAAQQAQGNGAAGLPKAPPKLTQAQITAAIDKLVAPLIRDTVVLGLSVGIVDGDQSYTINYGSRSTESTVAPTPDTIYEIGSITKTFTGTLLADAVVRKQVQLSDPVQKYLPQEVTVPQFEGTPITLLDLSTQHSGLPRMPSNFAPKNPRNPYVDYDDRRLYAFLSGYKLARKPGEKYEYSNVGVGLLGLALARNAGMSYEELVRSRILSPLGMNHTSIQMSADARKQLALGTNADCDPAANWELNALQGAGGILSSVTDMLRYLRANMDPESTGMAEALALAQKLAATIDGGGSIGLNWHILPGGDVVWHNGQTGGYASLLAFSRSTHRGVVVLCNTGSDVVTQLGLRALRMLNGGDPGEVVYRSDVKLKTSVLDKYVGRYQFAPGVDMQIVRSGDHLRARLSRQDSYKLYASSETEFFYRIVDAQVRFTVGANGRATELVKRENGSQLTAKRVE